MVGRTALQVPRPTLLFPGKGRTPSMNNSNHLSRRAFFAKVALMFNALAGTVLAVPVVGFLLSPVLRERKSDSESWVSLGGLDHFPEGETRLATYRNPMVNSWDGETANIACWVRRVEREEVPGFSVNCAHPRCPARWVPPTAPF